MRPWTSPGLADDLPHFPHVRKSGLKVPDLENHSKKCENGPKRAENDADDVAGASETAVEHLEDADGAQGPAQTHADVVDDVLAADDVGEASSHVHSLVEGLNTSLKPSQSSFLSLATFCKNNNKLPVDFKN